MLVIDQDGTEIARDVTVTGLGRGIETTGRFDQDAFVSTLDVIARYAGVLDSFDITTVKAVATSASRDALNGPDLMRSIAALLGVRPVIIDGDAEASLAFSGATRGLPSASTKLVIDIGGGSTEVVFGTETPAYVSSIDMGSVRLTDRFVGERPVPREVLALMRDECDRVFSSLDINPVADESMGVAGTFTNLSAMAMQLDAYDRAIVHGSQLELTSVTELIDRLSPLSIAATAKIPSLDPARASVILSGAVIAERVMQRCEVDNVTISEADLLEGLAAEMLG
ncbi:MAG: hypothetical protein ACC654_10430 [Acidimicrobiia bacterium]